MKTKLLLSILLLCALLQSNAQNVLPQVKPRIKHSLETNNQILMPNASNKNIMATQNLPYPIIFIHGLDSQGWVWNDLGTQLINYGLSYGGRIDFCLNDDGDNTTSNKNLWTSANNNIPAADIALYTDYNTNLSVADFYVLNFNIDNYGRFPWDSGFTDVLSNEAAIAKQGVALKYAIQIVLQKTGKDKVILMGHSMGGLASREYIQNSSNWQPDGAHHVAKLVTTGTPHGGFTGVNLSPTIDSKSEAYRDLKKSYVVSSSNGVYLFGGYENYPTMNNNYLYNFYNVDVNCNGIDGDNSYIIGLNQKTWISNIDYSYIIGECTNCSSAYPGMPGDGIVKDVDANLSNFTNQLPTPKNEFIYTAAASNPVFGLHTDLPQAIPVNMQGLDEPNEYFLSYGIDFNKTYKGFITQQPSVGGYPYDYDDYKFVTSGSGNLNFTISNTFTDNIVVSVYNMNMQLQGSSYSVPNGNWLITIPLSAGQYYLETYATPTTTSYLYPYTFNLAYTLSSDNFESNNSLKLFPNPTSSKVFFDNTNSNFKEVSIYNYLGQEVAKTNFTATSSNQEIDMSTLAVGVYVLKFSDGSTSKSIKVVKQ